MFLLLCHSWYALTAGKESVKERFHAAERRGQACLDYVEARKRSDEIQQYSFS